MIRTEIDNQISKILNTEVFKKSKILSKFLSFIVHETLQGNEHSLKEYVIATDVLKKNSDFDPQTDAIVRIHAHRLRQKLQNYYITKGKLDNIVVTIPKGRYVPDFNRKIETVAVNNIKKQVLEHKIISKPVLAVLPFEKIQNNKRVEILCSVLDHEIGVNLSRFSDIDVIASNSMHSAWETNRSIKDIISQFGLDYMITGSCFLNGIGVKVNIELNDVQNDHVVWADSFFIDDIQNKDLIHYKNIIQKVIAMTGGHFGVVYREVLNSHIPSELSHLYAVYLHQRYHRKFTEEAFIQAMDAIDKGLEKNPKNALLLAFKGELLLNMIVIVVEPEVDYLSLGTQFVEKSIDLDQNCQHAYQVLAWSNILHHNKKEFNRSINKMLSINPNDAMYSGSAGLGFICIGEYEKGINLMSDAIDLNPYYPWQLNLGYCLYFLAMKEFDEAYYWAKMINRNGLKYDILLRASTLGLLNRKEEADKSIKELNLIVPNFSNSARRIVNVFILDKKLQETIINGLVLAGVEIPN